MKTILGHKPKHLIFFGFLIAAFVLVYFSEKYSEDNTCKLKYPYEPCDYKQLITIQQVQNNQWVNVSQFSNFGWQDYRQLPQYGNGHAVFRQGSDIGEVHYNIYNATDFPLGTIAHLAQYFSEHTSLMQQIWVFLIVAFSFFILYLVAKFLANL